MDGAETLRPMRRIDAKVRAIVLSASEERNMERPFAGEYPAGLLSKPFSVDEIGEKLNGLLPLS